MSYSIHGGMFRSRSRHSGCLFVTQHKPCRETEALSSNLSHADIAVGIPGHICPLGNMIHVQRHKVLHYII